MLFKDNLTAQIKYLKQEQTRITKELNHLPEGKLCRKTSKGKTYFYEFKNQKYTSLANNKPLLKSYLQKNDLESRLQRVQYNLSLLESVDKEYTGYSPPDYLWDTLGSDENPFYKEHKIHNCNGIFYRSKSEMLIARTLNFYGIEFKYEPAYTIDGKTIYPDFVIKRPKDGKIFIWEHCGRMDLEKYEVKTATRIETYHYNGFYLWDNLILSFDKDDGSLDMDTIDRIIKLYLL